MAAPKPSRLLVIFLISLVTICFQLLATRVLAFVFWNHIVYLIISIALLGYGISSTILAIHRQRIERIPEPLFLGFNLLLFAASSLCALLSLSFLGIDLLDSGAVSVFQVAFSTLPLLLAYLFFLLPFLFSGNVVIYLFFRYPLATHRLYALDLVGAAAGCLLFVYVITAVGAIHGILICVLADVGISVPVLWNDRRQLWTKRLLALAATLAFVAVGLLGSGGRLVHLSVDSAKVLGVALNPGKNPGSRIEYSAWDVVSRVDVVSGGSEPLDLGWTMIEPPNRLVTFDGDAISHIPRRSPDFPTARDLATFETNHLHALLESTLGGDHLVIGLGGGPDLGTALLLQARSVTGVDINGALIRALRTRFADLGGQVFNRPNVRIVHSEGRSFLKRAEREYDLIYMSGVDTFTALNLGAYVLAENYLYTVEAVDDYTSHLSDRGMLYILRWFFPVQPRESLRLFATVLESLRGQGIEDPEQHVLVFKYRSGFNPGVTLVKKQPFTPQECAEILHRTANDHPDAKFLFLPTSCPPWTHAAADEARHFVSLQEAYAAGEETEYFDRYPYDVQPVDDDRPFFFKYYKLSSLWKQTWKSLTGTGPIQGYWSYLVSIIILAAATLAVCLFIWMPLSRFKRQGLESPGNHWATVYFAALGLGFIMLEIALMQKLALFLGHPMMSITAVLGGLLLFAGTGSAMSRRWQGRPIRGVTVALVTAAGMILLLTFLDDLFVDSLLRLPLALRILAALAAIAPLGVSLGFFFPLGLRIVERRDVRYVPWAWGINSGFTVIGSILAILVAMVLGFDAVMQLTIAIYGGGVLAIRRYRTISDSISARG